MQVTGTHCQKTEPQIEGKQPKTEPEGQNYAHGCQKPQVLEQQGWKTKDQRKAANLHYFTCTVMQRLRICCSCRMSLHGMRVKKERKQNIQNGKAGSFPCEGSEIVGQKPALAVNRFMPVNYQLQKVARPLADKAFWRVMFTQVQETPKRQQTSQCPGKLAGKKRSTSQKELLHIHKF